MEQSKDDWLETLMAMGFPPEVCREAAEQCDTLDACLAVCCDAGDSRGAASALEQLMEMGFDKEMAETALELTEGLEEAVEWVSAQQRTQAPRPPIG